MNKYAVFYNELRNYLVENKLEDASQFVEISEIEINRVFSRIPMAYKEWLKIFGSLNCLLNFPHFEDYNLENLIEIQDDEERFRQFDEEKRELLLITFMGLLYVYIVLEEENPTTYFVGLESLHSSQSFKNKGRFTTHIRLHIITLMKYLKSLNKLPESIKWFEDENIFEKTELYNDTISEIEKIEDEEENFFSITEFINFFNSKTAANSGLAQ